MAAVQPRSVPRHQENDQTILEWLQLVLDRHYKEGGNGRKMADTVIARFKRLSENEESYNRHVDSLIESQKMAMHQLQFSQGAAHQIKRRAAGMETNGRARAELRDDDAGIGDVETGDATATTAAATTTTEPAARKAKSLHPVAASWPTCSS